MPEMPDNDSKRHPTISVVIPLYQKRHRIETCLESVKAQTVPPFEVIVVDDGSTDGGGDLVQSFCADWVRYVRQENQGVSAARNRGIALSGGSHIAFLDADDAWCSDHIETIAHLAGKYPHTPIIGTNWSGNGSSANTGQIGQLDEIIDLDCFLQRASDGFPPYWTSAVAINKHFVGVKPLFPVGSRIAEDLDAWLQLLMRGHGYRVSKVTAYYHDDTVSSCIARARPEDFESVIFTKWSEGECYPSQFYWRFVEAHRLFTIQRHIGYAPVTILLRLLFEGKSSAFPLRRFGIVLRMMLQSIGLLRILRAIRHG